ARRPQEALGILHAFDISADHACGTVTDQEVEEITDLEIGLVTHREAMRESAARAPGLVEGGGHECAALTDEADRQLGQRFAIKDRRGTQGDSLFGADNAKAVWTDQTHAGATSDLNQLLLKFAAFIAGIGEAGRDDDTQLGTLFRS